MKQLLIIAFCFVTSLSWSQDWRDALDQARTLYKEKNYDKAYSAYLIALKGAPRNISLDAEVAQAAYKAKDYQKSTDLYSKNLRSKNINPSLLNHNLGNAYYQKQDYPKAVEAYKNALRKNPNDNETRYNLALALKKEQKNKQQQQNNQQNKQQNKQNQPPKKNNPPKTNPNKDNKENKSGDQQKNQDIAKDKTDRMLDDLMKKEMNTKKNLNKANAGSNEMNNGKDW